MNRWRSTLLLAATLLLHPLSEVHAAPRLRYPVAAQWLTSTTLVVANQRSGTLSLVDVAKRQVQHEIPLSATPTALAVSPDRQAIFVLDGAGHRLLQLGPTGEHWQVTAETPVARYPVSLVLEKSGRRAFITSLWSRRLDIVELGNSSLRVSHTLELPFAPRHQLLLPDQQQLLVADAFGGQLALVDVQACKLLHVRSLQAHNMAGLAWDAEQQRVLISHQILLETAATDIDNIQWGALMKNVVRVVSRDQLLDPAVNLTTATRVIALGSEGTGEGDPAGLLPLPDNGFLVVSSGTDNLVRVDAQALVTARIPVGERPVQVLATAAEDSVIVVNKFSDTLSLVDLNAGKVVATISLGEQPKLTPIERGERLFYSAQLSYDGWMSCHSCHPDGFTNGLRADTSGDGNFGAPKRTLSLLGVRDTDRWAWDGSIQNLPDQVRKSIATTLHGEATAENVFDLTAYLHTLEAPPASEPPADTADRAQIERGREVFTSQKCHRCHVPPLTYTSQESYDVDMADEHGQKKFNPPSLRGVGQGIRFFHDGRSQALEEVFQVQGHQLQKPLTDDELTDLVRFLRSL